MNRAQFHRAAKAEKVAKYNKIMPTRILGYQPKYHVTCTISDWYPACFFPKHTICKQSRLLKQSSSMRLGPGSELQGQQAGNRVSILGGNLFS